jgi:lipopolysaccharide export system protein LptA
MASRGMVALAFLLVLVAPSIAQDRHPAGRITATFYPAQGAAQRSKPGAAMPDGMIGPKVDPGAPIHIEVDSIVETSDGQAVFSGDVKLHQGDFLLRTRTLTAFYLGQFSVRSGDKWRAEQLTRVEAKERVLVTSKEGRTATQTATGQWATFDVMANTVLFGGEACVQRFGDDPVPFFTTIGERIKADLTTGMLHYEGEGAPTAEPANPTPRP